MALKNPIFSVLSSAQAPPRDSEISSFNANNLICGGSGGFIDKSRRSSIINGKNLYIDHEYNAHAIGVQSLNFDNIFEINTFSLDPLPFTAKFYSTFLSSYGNRYNVYVVESSSLEINNINLSDAVGEFDSKYSLVRNWFYQKYILRSENNDVFFSNRSDAEAIASQLNNFLTQNFSSSSIGVISDISQELRESYFSYINYFFFKQSDYSTTSWIEYMDFPGEAYDNKVKYYTSDNILNDISSLSAIIFNGPSQEKDAQNFIERLMSYIQYGYVLQEGLTVPSNEFSIYAGMRVQRVKNWVDGKIYRAGERVIYNLNGFHEYEKTTTPFPGSGQGPPSDSTQVYWKKIKNNVNSSNYTSTGFSVKVLDDQPIFCKQDIMALSLSDQRLKENISNLTGSIKKINKLRQVNFKWSEDSCVGVGPDIGLIAQDVEKVFPQAFRVRNNGIKCVNYKKIVPLLVAAIKENNILINKLKERNNER